MKLVTKNYQCSQCGYAIVKHQDFQEKEVVKCPNCQIKLEEKHE